MPTRIKSSQILDGSIVATDLHSAIAVNTTAAGTFGSVIVDTITIDAAAIATSGDLTLDSAGDIILNADGADVILADGAVEFGRFKRDAGDFVIKAETADKDIIFKGVKAGSPDTTITALSLDMSNDGRATFNENIVAGGVISTSDTTGSTNTTSGALTVAGGIGIAENAYIGGNVAVTGILSVTDTTTSTSSSTGSLLVSGGAGITENLSVGGNVIVTGNLTVEGTQVTLNTSALDVEDKNITLNYHASNDTSASADGAGITIQDAVDASNDASLLWATTGDKFILSHPIDVTGLITGTAGFTTAANTRIQSSSGMLFLSGPSALVFENGAGSEKMRLTSTGLGIDTQVPTAVLDVVGPAARPTSLAEMDSASTARFRSDDSNADSLYIAENVSGAIIQVNDGASNSTTAKDLVIQPFGGNVGIGTIAPKSRLDLGTGYMANEQGRTDHVANTMPSPYYELPQATIGSFSLGTSDNVKLNSPKFSIEVRCKNFTTEYDATTNYTLFNNESYQNNGMILRIGGSNLRPYFRTNQAGSANSVTGSRTLNDGLWHHIVVVYDGTYGNIYVDGIFDTKATMTAPVASANAASISAGGQPFEGSISKFALYNTALTADEVKGLYSGASVPFNHGGASQTDLANGWNFTSGWTAYGNGSIGDLNTYSSGTNGSGIQKTYLTVGKKYRVTVAGSSSAGDFKLLAFPGYDLLMTGFGTVEFTATETSLALSANTGSTVDITTFAITQIGAVAEYDGSSATSAIWYDKSGNSLDGTVSNATLQNKLNDLKVDGNLDVVGNVGIGTDSPSAWLQVLKDNDNSGNQFSVADTEGAVGAIRTYSISDPSSLILNHYYAVEGGGANEYMRYADFVANVGNGAGTTMRFITKNAANTYSTGLKIDNNGKVYVNSGYNQGNFGMYIQGKGAGVADARALHVRGFGGHTTIGGTGPTLVLQNADGTTNNVTKLSFETASNGEAVSINCINTNHSSFYGDMAFNTRGSSGYSEKLRIMANGNVGIGTSNPAQNFVVATATNGIGIELVPGTLNYIQAYNRGTSDYGDLKIDAQTIRFGVDNGAEKVRIDANGDVGIGTTDPLAKLHINKTNATATNTGFDGAELLLTGKGWDTNLGGYDHGWKISTPTVGYNSGTGSSNSRLSFTQLAADGGSGSANPSYIERVRIDELGSLEVRSGAALKVYRDTNAASAQLFMDAAEKLYIRNSYANKDIILTRDGELIVAGTASLKGNSLTIDSDYGHWSGRHQTLVCHNAITANQVWTDVAFVSYSPSLTIQGTAQRDNSGNLGMASYFGTIFGGYGSVTVTATTNIANTMNGGGFGQLEYRYLNGGASSGVYRLQVRQAITAGTMYITTTLNGQAFSQITED